MKKIIVIFCAAALAVPYVTTLAWGKAVGRWESDYSGGAGERDAEAPEREKTAGKAPGEKKEIHGPRVVLDRETGAGEEFETLDLEEYLIALVAGQIPADYELEAMKAQAILARTYVLREMGDQAEIYESALDVDCPAEETLTAADYRKAARAVEETKGVAASWNGALMEPLFHRVSAGKTRDGGEERPFLRSVECGDDWKSPDYMKEFSWTREELAPALNAFIAGKGGQAVPPENLPAAIQVAERDEAGYVLRVQVGGVSCSGEELQYALGLPSCSFQLGEDSGRITCRVKGSGHGYGFDQFGANEKAKAGWTAAELLAFYFENIVLISE